MPEFEESEGFKLRSGNKSPFKQLGSSPLKDESPHTGKNPTHGGHSKISDVFYPIKRIASEVKALFTDLIFPGDAWKAEAKRKKEREAKKNKK